MILRDFTRWIRKSHGTKSKSKCPAAPAARQKKKKRDLVSVHHALFICGLLVIFRIFWIHPKFQWRPRENLRAIFGRLVPYMVVAVPAKTSTFTTLLGCVSTDSLRALLMLGSGGLRLLLTHSDDNLCVGLGDASGTPSKKELMMAWSADFDQSPDSAGVDNLHEFLGLRVDRRETITCLFNNYFGTCVEVWKWCWGDWESEWAALALGLRWGRRGALPPYLYDSLVIVGKNHWTSSALNRANPGVLWRTVLVASLTFSVVAVGEGKKKQTIGSGSLNISPFWASSLEWKRPTLR